MTRGNMLSTEKIQKDSPEAENNTFWSDPSYITDTYKLDIKQSNLQLT